MNFYIPEIGAQIQLTEDWTFTLMPNESRNETFTKYLKLPNRENPYINGRFDRETYYRNYNSTVEVTIPKNSILKIDRIYIRKGNKDYSSVTFYVKTFGGEKGKGRFWAKLADVNTIQFNKVEE